MISLVVRRGRSIRFSRIQDSNQFEESRVTDDDSLSVSRRRESSLSRSREVIESPTLFSYVSSLFLFLLHSRRQIIGARFCCSRSDNVSIRRKFCFARQSPRTHRIARKRFYIHQCYAEKYRFRVLPRYYGVLYGASIVVRR